MLPQTLHTHTHTRSISSLQTYFPNGECLAKVDSMTTCVLCCPLEPLFIVALLLFLPPRSSAAQERQGAVLVLTSPSVTLTSHYRIQLVHGPALLLKQCVLFYPPPLPPNTHTHTQNLLFIQTPPSLPPTSVLLDSCARIHPPSLQVDVCAPWR